MRPNRAQALGTMAAALAAGALRPLAATATPRIVPTRLRTNRFIVLGRAPDGAELRFWLDNDGSGFISADVVRRYGLAPAAPDFFARLAPGGAVPPQARRL